MTTSIVSIFKKNYFRRASYLSFWCEVNFATSDIIIIILYGFDDNEYFTIYIKCIVSGIYVKIFKFDSIFKNDIRHHAI